MTDGTSQGLYIIVAVVIFGLLFIIVTTVIMPKTSKSMDVAKDVATEVVKDKTTLSGRNLGN